MTFAEAVRTCLQKYFQFGGRAPRSEYWWFMLFLFLAGAVCSIADGLLFPAMAMSGASPLSNLFSALTLIPSFSVSFRRLQDTGRPGWYCLVPLILIFATGFILLWVGLAVFGLQSGTITAENTERFGGLAMLLGILIVLTFASLIILLWWTTRPSEPGPNRWGPAPYGGYP